MNELESEIAAARRRVSQLVDQTLVVVVGARVRVEVARVVVGGVLVGATKRRVEANDLARTQIVHDRLQTAQFDLVRLRARLPLSRTIS